MIRAIGMTNLEASEFKLNSRSLDALRFATSASRCGPCECRIDDSARPWQGCFHRHAQISSHLGLHGERPANLTQGSGLVVAIE